MKDNNDQQFEFKDIAEKFQFEGDFQYAEPYGCGHINDTFAGYFKKSDGRVHRYILQRINKYVFKKPEELMSNIERVTRHLRNAVERNGGNIYRETLNLIETQEGYSYYKTQEGDYWRAYFFIEDAKTFEKVENSSHFYNAGKSFGKFQKQLDDFPAKELYETIPYFHNTEKRFEDFEKAVKNDSNNRVRFAEKEVGFFIKRKKDVSIVTELIARGKIPTRVTHNDTKFNNIMIDTISGEGICVLDLDTVMPGSALYDFGDSIRFGASSALEDERDISKVWLKIELFDAFAKGFLENTSNILTKDEIEFLAFSAKLMTLECGMRFLGDYINGDIYFKTHRESHNLDRARTQIKLVEDMECKMSDMEKVIRKYI